MKHLTPEQKKMEREYARMESVIASASKGQQSLRPRGSNGEYSQFQQECYAKYQSQIEAAQTRYISDWIDDVVAYIPYPIPPYDKEQK